MRLIDADRFYINYARRFSREPLKVEFFKQFLDAEPTVCDWISVTDDLPDEEGEYLIAWKGKLGMTEEWGRTFMEIAEYHFITAWDVQHIYDRGWTDVKVLAWMPLPKFYEE